MFPAGRGHSSQEGDNREYQRQSLRSAFDVPEPRARRQWDFSARHTNLGDSPLSRKVEPESYERSAIKGRASVRRGRFNHRLSLPGSEKIFTEVDLGIRRGHDDVAKAILAKTCESHDFEHGCKECIFIEIILAPARYDDLVSEPHERSESSMSIELLIDLRAGPYSTWSPMPSEGRVIKLLDQRQHVANSSELPEEFFACCGHSVADGDIMLSLPLCRQAERTPNQAHTTAQAARAIRA